MGWETAETWTAPDGARLSVRRENAAGQPRGTVVLVHGWGDYTGRWTHVARWFAAQGFTCFGADLRGHGQSPGRRGHVERFAQYLADLSALRKMASLEVPGPQVLVGHSFGGLVVLRYLETVPAGVSGAVLATPYIDLVRPVARWKIAAARLLGDLLPSVPIPTGLDYEAISRDPEVVRVFREDPLCHEVMTPRAWRESEAGRAALHAERERIGVPLQFLLAGDDRIVSTAAAAAFAKSLRGDVVTRTYQGMYHNILHEPDRDQVFADLAPWLDRVVPGRVAA